MNDNLMNDNLINDTNTYDASVAKNVSLRRHLSYSAILMCALAAIFYCYEYYLRVAPSVMSGELKSAFNLSDASFGHLAAFYYYAYTPMQIPVGMLLDRFGPKRVLTVACLICALGTYVFATTKLVWIAQLGRFFVGFGSAFAYVGILKISDVWLPKKYFALMAGIGTTLGMLGAIFGALSMASMVTWKGWQSTLYYSVGAGLILTIILWWVLKDEPDKAHPSAKTYSVPKVAVVLQGLSIMVRNREMWINGLIGCLTFLPITAFAELWAVPFLETVGFTKSDAALGSSLMFLGFALGGPCWGILSDIFKNRRYPMIIGSLIAALLMALLILFPSPSKLWMYSLLFFASAFTSVEILVFAVSNDQNSKEVSATAASFTNMMTMIGGALLPPIIGKILDLSVTVVDGLPYYSVANYTFSLMILPLGLVLAAILCLNLKESYHRTS